MSRHIFTLTVLLLGLPAAHAQQEPQKKLALLLQTVKSAKAEQRTEAVAEIAKLEPGLAVPALIGLWTMPDEEVRLNAALGLSGIGKPALPALEKALGDAHEGVRFHAVWALGMIGPAAKATTPA